MKINVYNCEEKVLGIIYLSSKGWDGLEVHGGGEALKGVFEKYKYLNPIPVHGYGKSEDKEKVAYYTSVKWEKFGDKDYLIALESELRNYGEFLLYWTKEQYERLMTEYMTLISTSRLEERKAA